MHPNGTVPRRCETCGAVFFARAYRVRAGHARFCSVACFAKAPHPWAVGGPVDPAKKHDVTCAVCGTTFQAYAASPGRYEHRYCGNACAHEGQRVGREARFWAKVDKSGPVPPHRPELGPCWLWTGSRFRNGYGQCTRNLVSNGLAHRAAWELTNGPIPDGLDVLHHCDVPACVNPGHLWLGTKADNAADMWRKGRHPRTALLTPDDVRRIRALLAAGWTRDELTRVFRVSYQAITDIDTGRTWQHIV